MRTITFTVDGPPVPWGRARTHGKVHFTPAKTRSYESFIKICATQAMEGSPPIDCAVRVSVRVFIQPPKRLSKKKLGRAIAGLLRPITRPDVDNYLKAALDGMNQIVFRDDGLVVSAGVGKFYSERPRMEITVTKREDFS